MQLSSRATLIVLGAIAMGCQGAVWDRTEVSAPAASSKRSPSRWQQYCTFHPATNLKDVNQFLAEQADHGWELVSVAGQHGTVYCFKAPTDAPNAQPPEPPTNTRKSASE